MINRKQAESDRTMHRYIPGRGYLRMGRPLQMPPSPLGNAPDCEPPHDAADGSVHMLRPPEASHAAPMPFAWHRDRREWAPVGANGRRMAFTSAYLAAYGWTYGGAA